MKNKTLLKRVNGWNKKLDKAIKTGKGKFAWTPIRDLHDYKRMIKLIKQGKLSKAFEIANDFDTCAREDIPTTIWDTIGKEWQKECGN